jgi:excisionase family DNA binding protein
MVGTRPTQELMTPEQAAECLQVSRETIYRYIRQGKLLASKLGRSHQIPRASVDSLLWATKDGRDFEPHEYTTGEVEGFIRDDQLDEQTRAIVERFSAMMDVRAPRELDPAWPSAPGNGRSPEGSGERMA